MADPLGILVIGHSRPDLLTNVLESLSRQGAAEITHVWIDGTGGRRELTADVHGCAEAVNSFNVREVRAHAGPLGTAKLLLNGMRYMASLYDKIIVIEDDCFPTYRAVEVFSRILDEVAQDDSVYSVYGHPFLVENERPRFTRFQGWGWATTAGKLMRVLPELERLFLLDENTYLRHAQDLLTKEVRARLDVTPGRNVLEVMSRFFTWDSCTALVTASLDLAHVPTPVRVIFNCGMDDRIGRFPTSAAERFRKPPFNMISPSEVWEVFRG